MPITKASTFRLKEIREEHGRIKTLYSIIKVNIITDLKDVRF